MATNNSWNNAIADANSAITLNSGTNTVSISTDAAATTINIATGAAAKVTTVGSTNTTSSTAIKSGTGNVAINSGLTIDSTGRNYNAVQPAFLAVRSATVNNVTGTGNFYQFVPDTVIFDKNSNYNNSTGTFTAPITGTYVIQTGGTLIGCTINTQITLRITTSNRVYQYNVPRAASSANNQANMTIIADMDAADTATFFILGAGEAGNTDDLYGDGTPQGANCSAYLAC